MMGRKSSMSTAFLLHTLLVAATVADEAFTVNVKKLGCQASCGVVDVPYPFGIDKDCFRPGFEIVCVNNTPVLPAAITQRGKMVKVLSLSVMPRPEARVMLPVAWQCFNSTGDPTGQFQGSVDFNMAGVYRISDAHNELVVLGCNSIVYTNSGPPGRFFRNTIYAGCLAYCEDSQSARDDACAGVGCCHVDIPPGLTDNWMGLTPADPSSIWSHVGMDMDFCPCEYAFIVEKDKYTFKVADLHMDTETTMPLLLDWAIRDGNVNSTTSASCADAANKPDYTCVSKHSECIDSTNGPGYFCNCTKGYHGNPYLEQGCTNINECARSREQFPCYGECHDTEGSYSCRCPKGYDGDPMKSTCTPKFSPVAKLSLGICLGVSSIIVALLIGLVMLQKRKLDKLFEKNGGKILKNVKGLTIFSKEGLKKITKNNSEFLGNGSFGKVYKGTLPDNTMVAVKTSIKVNEDTKQEFTEEVQIHTHMIHKNILRLIGCCLEVDVPMLIYEYAANGSLQEILHGNRNRKLPLDLRLDIAIGSAEGLRYMHSSTTQAIRHGDVKPDNILLDDKLTPKISDFGLSKLLKEEYFAKTVVGCMGYIDPVFMKTGLLTQKSDVYSFGAVLLELITGKKNVYDENHSLIIEFCKVYEQEKSGRSMFDKDIAIEEDIFILEEIGKLAIECLREDIESRPDMTEVAEQLVMLRRGIKSRNKSLSNYDDISIDVSPNNTDISEASSATFSVPSTPTN